MSKKSSIASSEAPARHPIAVVAERTGLSRDVLRVWERRYAAVEPQRSAGGQRLYSDADVTRFRLLATAISRGRSIGVVAALANDELARLVADDESARPPAAARADRVDLTDRVEAALEYTRALDGPGLDRELRLDVARNGLTAFLEDIVPELMCRIGEDWRADRLGIAHEHLASATVLAIILESIRAVPPAVTAPRLLVATPSGERHAVGAALAAAGAALVGWAGVYLGVDVPAADIVAAAAAAGAAAVAVSVVHAADLAFVSRELSAVRAALSASVPLFVGGAAATKLSLQVNHPGVLLCRSIAEMRAVLVRGPVLA